MWIGVVLGGPSRADEDMFATTIADYLGLAIKTVSRTMSQFASEASIGLPSSRRIVLRNVAPCAS